MTDEELRRLMDFIREQQAELAAKMLRREKEQIPEYQQTPGLEESFQCLARLVEKNRSRFENSESRFTSFEDADQCLNQLLEKSKRKLAGLN